MPRDLDEDDIANICHVSAAPVPALLGLLNIVAREARMGVTDVSCEQEYLLKENGTIKAFPSHSMRNWSSGRREMLIKV